MNSLSDWINTTYIGFQSIELTKAFLIFIMFSVIGWICEVLYVGLFFEHKFVNRGFLHGPLCPIYGVGGILILSLPKQLQNPVWVLFLSGVFFCSLVEYIGSWALEKMFHTKWWDYSGHKITVKGKTIPLNIKGRICLLNSILFGVMTVAVIKFVQPLVDKFLNLFPDIVLYIASDVLLIAFVIDLIATVHKLVDFSVYMSKLKELGETLKERYENEIWFRSSSLKEMFESVKEKSKEEGEKFSSALLEKVENALKTHKISDRFLKKFPHMKSVQYNLPLTMLKDKLKDKVDQIKAEKTEKKAKKSKKN